MISEAPGFAERKELLRFRSSFFFKQKSVLIKTLSYICDDEQIA